MKSNKLASLSFIVLGAVAFVSTDGRADERPPQQVHGVNFMIRSALDENFCIDASLDRDGREGVEGRRVFIFRCHGRENQRWTFTDGSDGSAVIVGHGGMCLDIRGHKTGDGTPVEVWKCHYGANQRFVMTTSGRLREVQSGKCLTIGREVGDRKAVFIDECDEQVKQQTWRLSR